MKSSLVRVALALGAGAALALPVQAGGVRIVCAAGDQNFPDIASAVAAAQAGDVLLVGEGTYGPFTIDGKSLSIWAAPGATVTVDNALGVPGICSVANLAAHQAVIVSGLEIRGGAHSATALLLASNQGFVRIQDCSVSGWGGWFADGCQGANGRIAVAVNACARLALLRTTIRGGSGEWVSWALCYCPDGLDCGEGLDGASAGDGAVGMEVSSSRVACYDSVVSGGAGGSFDYKTGCGDCPGNGATAMQISASEVFASGSTFLGGGGGIAYCGIPPLCSVLGSGGYGVYVDGFSVLDALDCDLVGGVGAPPGAPWSGSGWMTPLPGSARKLSAPAILPEYGVFDVELAGLTGDAVWLPRSGVLDHELYVPLLSVWLIGRPLRMPRVPAAILPPGGMAATLPPLSIPAGATHAQCNLQGMFVSPGEARLGSARHMLGLSITVGPDCDGNGTSDYVDVLFGGAPDLNHNLIPDGCPGG